MTAYSKDLRQKIIEVYEQGGTSIRRVAERFGVSKGVVQRLLERRKAGEDLTARKTGPKTVGQLEQHREAVVKLIESQPDWTLEEYCQGWLEQSGISVSRTTMWRFIESQQLPLKKRPTAALKRRQKRDSISDLPTGSQ